MQRQRITDDEVKKIEEKLKESEAKLEEARAKSKEQSDKINKPQMEQYPKDKSESDRQRKMFGFQINQQDRAEWISNSPFKNQIQQIQETIARLDSFLVWNGRAKAQAIRNALTRAIDAAIKHEAGSPEKKRFQNFSEFAQFSKYEHTGLFSNTNYASLEDCLSIHRFPDIDALFGKDKPDSDSILPKKP